MKRKIVMALAVVGCLSLVQAEGDTVDWEQYKQEKKQEIEKIDKQKKLVVQIEMLLGEAIETGNQVLASLEGNLNFLEKIESDEQFRDCVVLKENLKKISDSRAIAKDLLKNREVTQKQFDGYKNKLNGVEVKLNLKISKMCK